MFIYLTLTLNTTSRDSKYICMFWILPQPIRQNDTNFNVKLYSLAIYWKKYSKTSHILQVSLSLQVLQVSYILHIYLRCTYPVNLDDYSPPHQKKKSIYNWKSFVSFLISVSLQSIHRIMSHSCQSSCSLVTLMVVSVSTLFTSFCFLQTSEYMCYFITMCFL